MEDFIQLNSSDKFSNSSNGSSCETIAFDDFSKVKIGVLLVLFILTTVANIHVLLVTYSLRRRQSIININRIITHLCIADLLVGVFCMLGEALWTLTSQWYGGDLLCKVFKFGQTFSATLSTMIICVISIDRAVMVLLPLHRSRIEQRSRRFLIVAFVISVLTSSPQLGLFTVAKAPFKKPFYQCIHLNYIQKFPNWANQTFFWVNYSVNYLIPLAFISCTYTLVLIKLQSESKRQFGCQNASPHYDPNLNSSSHETSFSITVTKYSSSKSRRNRRNTSMSKTQNTICQGASSGRSSLLRRAKIKSLQLSFMIVLSFLICWTPYYIVYLLSTQMLSKCVQPKESQMQYIFFFGQLSGVFNPLIYGMFHCHDKKRRS